jgi:hypothetical protein
MIYSGAIIFDLVFFAIEAQSKASKRLKGAYYGSIVLAIVNGFITLVGMLGAFGIVIIEKIPEGIYQLAIQKGDFTDVYNVLLSVKVELWIYMTLVLAFGLAEVVPGLLLAKENSQKQIDSSD